MGDLCHQEPFRGFRWRGAGAVRVWCGYVGTAQVLPRKKTVAFSFNMCTVVVISCLLVCGAFSRWMTLAQVLTSNHWQSNKRLADCKYGISVSEGVCYRPVSSIVYILIHRVFRKRTPATQSCACYKTRTARALHHARSLQRVRQGEDTSRSAFDARDLRRGFAATQIRHTRTAPRQ